MVSRRRKAYSVWFLSLVLGISVTAESDVWDDPGLDSDGFTIAFRQERFDLMTSVQNALVSYLQHSSLDAGVTFANEVVMLKVFTERCDAPGLPSDLKILETEANFRMIQMLGKKPLLAAGMAEVQGWSASGQEMFVADLLAAVTLYMHQQKADLIPGLSEDKRQNLSKCGEIAPDMEAIFLALSANITHTVDATP